MGGDPQDPLRVSAGRGDEEEQRGARALLPKSLPPVLGPPGPGEGKGQAWRRPAAGRKAGRRKGRAPIGLSWESLAQDGVWLGWRGPPLTGAGPTGWTCATPSSTRRGLRRLVAGSSVGAPARFSERTAGKLASPRNVLALPAGLCRAAACAACASTTAPATSPRTVASCTQRRARSCSGPFPLERGIVLRALQCAASGGRQGANTCNRCATDMGSLTCT